jgi:hypothetical protein
VHRAESTSADGLQTVCAAAAGAVAEAENASAAVNASAAESAGAAKNASAAVSATIAGAQCNGTAWSMRV